MEAIIFSFVLFAPFAAKLLSMPEKPQLDRFGVAAALQEIAQLMDLKGGQFRFKAKAYNAGARAIQGVADLDRLVREDSLTTLPRIGDALASQIVTLRKAKDASKTAGDVEEKELLSIFDSLVRDKTLERSTAELVQFRFREARAALSKHNDRSP